MEFESKIRTIQWVDNVSRMVDQTKFPEEYIYVDIKNNPEEEEGVHSFDFTHNPYGFRVKSYVLGYVGTPQASEHYLDVAKQVIEKKSEEQ